jgi:2-oxo-3-hexenedioate decarboxylase
MASSGTDSKILEQIARTLDGCVLNAREIKRFTLEYPSFSIAEGYTVQDQGIAMRTARGEKIVGLKMGLTSRAKMKQMGVESPIMGVLTSSMIIKNGGVLRLEGRIHPKVEPEVAFLIDQPLRGRVTREQALAACKGVVAAVEVIDSRYENFDFQLPDVVADNCSGSGFILGDVIKSVDDLDLGNLGMVMSVSGEATQFGSSSAILGHPADSLVELVHMLEPLGRGVEPGMIVLAGGATAAVRVAHGARVVTEVQGLGKIEFTVE